MIDVSRFPVVIVASPRTGSTALLKYLANKYSVFGFGEIFMNTHDLINKNKRTYDEILTQRKMYFEYVKSNRIDYVLKLMPKEINHFSKYEKLLQSNCFKIRLTRRSLTDQVASMYVAEKTKIFHTYATDQTKEYEIKINKIELINCIEHISNTNYLVKNIKCDYDILLDYEDLGFLPENAGNQRHTIIFHKPINYQKIKNTIKEILNSSGAVGEI